MLWKLYKASNKLTDVCLGYDADVPHDEGDETQAFARIPFCEDSPDLATIRTQAYRDAWEACQNDIRVSMYQHNSVGDMSG